MNIEPVNNSLLQSRTYILWDKHSPEIFLIDCGDTEPIIRFVRLHGKTIGGILLTHCHYDHIYGLRLLLETYPSIKLLASKDTETGLRDARVNLSRYHGQPFELGERYRVTCINAASSLRLFDTPVRILETPGHDAGCLSYLIGDSLFTGDSHIPRIPVFYKWKRSDKALAIENEHRLRRLVEERSLKLYPGHYL